MVKLKLNGHPDFMDEDTIKLSKNNDNRLSWTDDGKLTDISGIVSHTGRHPGNGIAGTGGFYDGTITKGDVNQDGTIDEADVNKIITAATRIGTGKGSWLTSEQEYAADYNGDGTINTEDAVSIMQLINDNGPMSANKLTNKIQCDTSVSRIRRINNSPDKFVEDGFYIPNLVKGILSLPNLSTQRNSVIVTEHDTDIIERKEVEPGHYIERLVTKETIAEQLQPLKEKINPITGLKLSDKDFEDLVELTYQQLQTSESVLLKSDDYDYTKWTDPSYIHVPERSEYPASDEGAEQYQSAYEKAVAGLEERIHAIRIPASILRNIADSDSAVPMGWSSGKFDNTLPDESSLVQIGAALSGQTYYPTTSGSGDDSVNYQAGGSINMYGSTDSSDGTYASQYANGPLISVINAVVLAYEAAGIYGQDGCYSQTNYVDITVNGITFSARPDCSGLIQAVLTVMGYSSSGLNSTGLCNSSGIKYKDGTMSNDFEYIRNPATYQIQAGDFLARYGHAEIGGCIVDGKLYGWNFGWDGGIKKTIAAAHNMVGTSLSESDLQNAFVNANATLGNGSYEVIIRYKGSGTTTPVAGSSGSASGSSNFPNISDEDYVLLCNCVAHEAGSNSISTTDKAYVVEVIMNRVASSDFPDTIRGVITQKGQFEGSSSYSNLTTFSDKVTSMVKEAVNLYFSDPGSFNQGYLYFYGDGSQNHFSVGWHGKG